MDCIFEFTKDTIKPTYIYDNKEIDKMILYENEYDKWLQGEQNKDNKPKLKAYASMYVKNGDEKSEFQKEIEKIVDLTNIKLDVKIKKDEKKYNKNKTFLSDSNFINLYNFATVLNGRYAAYDEWKTKNISSACVLVVYMHIF